MAKRFIGGEIVSNIAPAGSITAFAGSSAPDGWIFCQGQELLIEDYPELYAAIGTTWNNATNPTSGSAYGNPASGYFRLPDFRGAFLRGAGNPSQGDNTALAGYQTNKTAPNGLKNSSSSVSGSGAKNQLNRTTNSTGSPSGIIERKANRYGANNAGPSGWYAVTAWNSSSSHAHTVSYSGNFSISGTAAAQGMTGDSETRPLNQGVNYIIKL